VTGVEGFFDEVITSQQLRQPVLDSVFVRLD